MRGGREQGQIMWGGSMNGFAAVVVAPMRSNWSGAVDPTPSLSHTQVFIRGTFVSSWLLPVSTLT